MRLSVLKMSVLLVLIGGFGGCTQPGDSIYEEYEVAEVGDFVDYATNIQPIFDNNCGPCHLAGGASGGVSLDDYDKVSASGVIAACDPEGSLLYLVLLDPPPAGSLKMPMGGELGPDDIETIKQWISEGSAAATPTEPLCVEGGSNSGGADAVSSDTSP